MTKIWHSGMKQMPPPDPIADPDIAVFNALNNPLQKLDPIKQKIAEALAEEQLKANLKAIQGKAPRNAQEAEFFAALTEQAEINALKQGKY